MATTQKVRTIRQNRNEDFGQLAYGSSGQWEIAIDEALSGSDRWWAQIDGPAVSLYFGVPSLETVDKVSRFFASRASPTKKPSHGSSKRSETLVVGNDKKTTVTLLGDDEYDDRLFLVVGPAEGPMIRFVVAGADLAQIAEALKQVKDDLDDED